ncbi:MAG: hypothetical protein QOJ92_263 [Frankiales bacterium]|nr:hypothetical protein [Frankiales bacterium]
MPTLSAHRPLDLTHIGSRCHGRVERHNGDDGHCPTCDELLPGVYGPLAPNVTQAAAVLSDDDRAAVNVFAAHQARSALAESFPIPRPPADNTIGVPA